MCGLEGERQALRAELERSGVSSESVDSVLARVRAQTPDAARSEKLYVPGTGTVAGAEPPRPVAAHAPATTSSASTPSALPAASTASSAAAESSIRSSAFHVFLFLDSICNILHSTFAGYWLFSKLQILFVIVYLQYRRSASEEVEN